MGTTTFYLRKNDYAKRLYAMTKKELKLLDELSPYGEDPRYMGWEVPFELHNGNVYVLVFWKGRLMKLEKAPESLNKKYYSSYRGKTMKKYEWTLLKKMMMSNLEYLDKKFKNQIRRLSKASKKTGGKA